MILNFEHKIQPQASSHKDFSGNTHRIRDRFLTFMWCPEITHPHHRITQSHFRRWGFTYLTRKRTFAFKFNNIKSVKCKQSAQFTWLTICSLDIKCDFHFTTCLSTSNFTNIESQGFPCLYLVHIVSSDGNGNSLSFNLKKTTKAIVMWVSTCISYPNLWKYIS